MIQTAWSRRSFLKFMGSTTALASTGCTSSLRKGASKPALSFKPGLNLNTKSDSLSLSQGLNYEILLKEGQKIGRGLFFGTNNDYLNLYKFDDGRFGLWVNHESLSPTLLYGRKHGDPLSKYQLRFERSQLGGSFIEVKQNPDTKKWSAVTNSKLNFKVSGNTKIPFSQKLRNQKAALGTLANCSGGYTPWGTILTCEENYAHFYGERHYDANGKGTLKKDKRDFGWLDVDPKPTEHYGWVVEVDPRTKKAEKLVSLGRFAHECATVTTDDEGYPVVYSGDDSKNECLYKFVSSKKDSLKEGTLYVADLKDKAWISLDIKDQPVLQENFKDQTEVLIRVREAAKLVGGTPLDRPEDIEVDPLKGDVYVTLTNNKPKGNYHGSILKISEKNKSDLYFKHKTFRAGGTKSGFSCPDNMAFDQNGNLWMTSDISGGSLGKGDYKSFGNNGLFIIPRRGRYAGKVLKLASAPNDAEFTGPFFSPDQKTLFLSVQHPGEKTKKLGEYTSSWPSGKEGEKPLSCVVTLTGELLEHFTQPVEPV